MLYRMPKFWILGGAGIFAALMILTGTTLATFFDGTPPGEFFLEGTESFLVIYFFSYAQALLIIFVAGDFRKAEEKARLDQVMLSRPMTTANWVIGKYFGVVSALLVLNVALVFIALIGRTIKALILDLGFDLVPTLQYYTIATIPSILFMTSLMFFFVSLFRVQSIAILLSLAFWGGVLFYFQADFLGMFDYGTFWLPLFASDLVGFGDISHILKQRLFYTLLAFALLAFSIILYPRLRQSNLSQRMSQAFAVLFLAGAAYICFDVISEHQTVESKKSAAIDAQDHWVNAPLADVEHYDFKISFGRQGAPLAVELEMSVVNPGQTPLDTLVFALNGGLKVQNVEKVGGSEISFKQEHQLLLVNLKDAPLEAGEKTKISLSYAGTIDADAFALDFLPDEKGLIDKKDGPWNIGEFWAYLTKDFALLPAEAGWYPAPGTAGGYDFNSPKPKNFATARFEIKTPRKLTAITQGFRASDSTTNGARTAIFEVETPLPAFSLNIGEYAKLARNFKQTTLELYYRKNHLRGLDIFSDVADTCFQVIEEILDGYENTTGQAYPYPKLAYVETPMQTQIFLTRSGYLSPFEQPQIIMIDERDLAGRYFEKLLERKKKRAQRRRRDDSDARLKRDVFVEQALRYTIGRGRSEWNDNWFFNMSSPTKNYFHHQIDLTDHVLGRALELHLFENVEKSLKDKFYPDRWNVNLSTLEMLRSGEGDWIHWRFRRYYRTEYDSVLVSLEETPLSDFLPEKDGNLYRGRLDIKGSAVFEILKKTMGDDGKNFRRALDEVVTNFKYKKVTPEDFFAIMNRHSEAPLGDFYEQWFRETTFPGYRITSTEVEKLDTGKMQIAYLVKARVQNGEKGAGFVQVFCDTKNDKIKKNIRLGSYEEKEVHFVVKESPRQIRVLPDFSRNRGSISQALTIPTRTKRGVAMDTIFAVNSNSDSTVFYADDRDDGFFLPVGETSKYLRPAQKGKSWWENMSPRAYGKYYFGWRYKRGGEGDFPAHWEVKPPRSGFYDLSFHMPVSTSDRRTRWWASNLSKSFKINIVTSKGRQPVEMKFIETADGWIYLGRFQFEKDEAALVELSDEGDGWMIADAIRWEYVQ